MSPVPRGTCLSPAAIRCAARSLPLAAMFCALLLAGPAFAQSGAIARASQLLDISGVSWVDGDAFLVVHDGKSDPTESSRPRVSLLLLPNDVSSPPDLAREATDGAFFRDIQIDWHDVEPNDLESIARIPGTRQFLFAESGDDCTDFQRIFLASVDSEYAVTIDDATRWPSSAECAIGAYNVEAMAVFRLGGHDFLVYAERAEGLPSTELRWARLALNPLRLGPFSSVRFSAKERGEGVRPIVALEVDSRGDVYAATAYDPGDDGGPFRSWVSKIGQFRAAPRGGAQFVPSGKFGDVARQDGYKIEGIAVRPTTTEVEVYAGTDDENWGADFRKVAPLP
jgi:hypothetical protein